MQRLWSFTLLVALAGAAGLCGCSALPASSGPPAPGSSCGPEGCTNVLTCPFKKMKRRMEQRRQQRLGSMPVDQPW